MRATGVIALTVLILMTAAASTAALPRSAIVSEILKPADARKQPAGPPSASFAERLARPDPYDEFAEPRRLDWPESRSRSRSRSRRRQMADRIRRRLLWRLSHHPELTAALAKPLPAHPRDSRLDRPDPYRELASEAYYRFVRAILDMRNRMVAVHGFDETSAIGEFFEKMPSTDNGGRNSTTTAAPTGGPEITPSPPVQVCPPRWRLGDHRCEKNATFCFHDSECPDSRCCFDGCKLRCLETELLVRHVCRDYTNSSVFPGDLYMRQREQICTCDELGRPQTCKDKKPCVDVISSALFKLPYISNETVRFKKRERTTRQKIYDALQEAFKHVKKVY